MVVVGCGVAMGLGSSPVMGGEHLEIIKKKRGKNSITNNWSISRLESSP